MAIERCYCGGLLYPAVVSLHSRHAAFMVQGWRCAVCGEEEIDAAVSQAIDRNLAMVEALHMRVSTLTEDVR